MWCLRQPQSTRHSLNSRVEYDLTPRLRAFGEFTGYFSTSMTQRQPITLADSDRAVTLSSNNPYNPFGARFYSPTGTANPDGTARLTGNPQTITIGDMLMADGGPETIETSNRMHRLLVGLQGKFGTSSWEWEVGAMTGGVRATDSAVNSIRDSLLIAAAQRTDAIRVEAASSRTHTPLCSASSRISVPVPAVQRRLSALEIKPTNFSALAD